jgi:hypothetical protein
MITPVHLALLLTLVAIAVWHLSGGEGDYD